MNWTRGLLRIWAVFAVCWVGVGMATRYPQLTSMTSEPKSFREWLDNGFFPLPPSPLGATNLDGSPIVRPPAGYADAIFDKDPSRSLVLVRISSVADWPVRIRAAEWILLPPLGLLLFGFMVVWAARGFRP